MDAMGLSTSGGGDVGWWSVQLQFVGWLAGWWGWLILIHPGHPSVIPAGQHTSAVHAAEGSNGTMAFTPVPASHNWREESNKYLQFDIHIKSVQAEAPGNTTPNGKLGIPTIMLDMPIVAWIKRRNLKPACSLTRQATRVLDINK